MNEEEIIINIGDVCTLRNGMITGPLRIANNGTRYIYEADVEDGSILAWTPNGRFLTSIINNRYDIISIN